jgi:hypothetical protein
MGFHGTFSSSEQTISWYIRFTAFHFIGWMLRKMLRFSETRSDFTLTWGIMTNVGNTSVKVRLELAAFGASDKTEVRDMRLTCDTWRERTANVVLGLDILSVTLLRQGFMVIGQLP